MSIEKIDESYMNFHEDDMNFIGLGFEVGGFTTVAGACP